MALVLKWLTNNSIFKKWPLMIEELQALEQLLQEQLDAQHIENHPPLEFSCVCC